jgi:predicted Zn-dependent protease
MSSSSQPYRNTGKVVSRSQFLIILQAALDSSLFRFVRQAALNWLAVYPGDMETSLILARALAGDDKKSQAIAIVNRLVRYDPEFAEAWQFLSELHGSGNPSEAAQAQACAVALGKG